MEKLYTVNKTRLWDDSANKTRLWDDSALDHQLLISKFRFTLKDAKKTTMPFMYDPQPPAKKKKKNPL